jgi:hypothetical protein
MPDLSRRIVKLAASDLDPDGQSSDPFEKATAALRMGAVDDFEEEVETSEDSLGRPVDVGRTLEVSYFVREDASTGDGTIVGFLKGKERAWIRETYQEQEGSQRNRIVGAPEVGARIYTAEATVDGLKGTMITATTSSVTEADNYFSEPSYNNITQNA